MSVDGGAQQTLADAERYGGSWNRRGTILYAPIFGNPLMRVSADGGPSSRSRGSTRRAERSLHCWPAFLPDDDHFLYLARAIDPAKSAIRIGSLGSRQAELLTPADGGPIYVDSGYLLFSREGALLAQRFDPFTRELSGDPFPLARKVTLDPSNNDLSASATAHLLVYQAAGPRNKQLTWVDRTGRAVGTSARRPEFWTYALSPDEKHIAASIADSDRWTATSGSSTPSAGRARALTSRPTDEFNPRGRRTDTSITRRTRRASTTSSARRRPERGARRGSTRAPATSG
jgi:hypothetical protein